MPDDLDARGGDRDRRARARRARTVACVAHLPRREDLPVSRRADRRDRAGRRRRRGAAGAACRAAPHGHAAPRWPRPCWPRFRPSGSAGIPNSACWCSRPGHRAELDRRRRRGRGRSRRPPMSAGGGCDPQDRLSAAPRAHPGLPGSAPRGGTAGAPGDRTGRPVRPGPGSRPAARRYPGLGGGRAVRHRGGRAPPRRRPPPARTRRGRNHGPPRCVRPSRRLQSRGELRGALGTPCAPPPRPAAAARGLARDRQLTRRARLLIMMGVPPEGPSPCRGVAGSGQPGRGRRAGGRDAGARRAGAGGAGRLPVTGAAGAQPVAVDAWLLLATVAVRRLQRGESRTALRRALQLAAPETQRRAVQQVWAQLRRGLRDDHELAEQYRALQGASHGTGPGRTPPRPTAS